MKHTSLPTASMQKASFLLETCIHPISRRIIHLLSKNDEMTIMELSQKFCFDFDKVRFQLGLLQKLNIVQKVDCTEGISYYLNSAKLLKIKLLIGEFSDNYVFEEVS